MSSWRGEEGVEDGEGRSVVAERGKPAKRVERGWVGGSSSSLPPFDSARSS